MYVGTLTIYDNEQNIKKNEYKTIEWVITPWRVHISYWLSTIASGEDKVVFRFAYFLWLALKPLSLISHIIVRWTQSHAYHMHWTFSHKTDCKENNVIVLVCLVVGWVVFTSVPTLLVRSGILPILTFAEQKR